MTRSQSADIAASALIISMVAEVRTEIGRQWANRYVSREVRDLFNAFVLASEEAAGRLALRSGSSSAGGAIGETVRPSSNDAPASKEEAA